MSKKKPFSIYPGPPLKAWMAHRPTRRSLMSIAEQGRDTSHTISDTVAINRLAERYQHALAWDFPIMHEATWLAVGNALNGYTETGFDEVMALPGIVADDRYGGPEEIPEGDEPEEITELAGCSTIQRFAIVEVIERVWGCDPAVSVREAVSLISNRPPWSVFKEDPAPKAFWHIERLTDESVDGFLLTHTECSEIAVRVVHRAGFGYRIENPDALNNARHPLTTRERVTDDIVDLVHAAEQHEKAG